MNAFNKDDNPQSPAEAIQDYLDLLLTPTREVHNQVNDTHSDSIIAGHLDNGDDSPFARQADTIALQSDRQTLLERRRQHCDRSSPLLKTMQGESVQQTAAFERARPYADPVKPLTLRMPLPAIANKIKITIPIDDQAPVPPLVKEKPLPEFKVAKKICEKTLLPVTQGVVAPVVEPALQHIDKSVQSVAENTSVRLENGRPVWAQERFQCLLFTAGGLTLAVPLVELGSIYPLNKPLTHLFGQIDWFMGLLTVKEQRIRTVNTAKVVMPERYQEAMEANFRYVITINDVDWGLAVDNVATAITLAPNEVNWRTQRGKRPWLAGTVVEHMCALLDVSQLATMFTAQDKGR